MNDQLEILDEMPVEELKDLCSWVVYPELWGKVQDMAAERDATPADVLIALILEA